MLYSSDGEVKRYEPVTFQHNCIGKRFITRSFHGSCCGRLVVIKMNNTFQSAVIITAAGFTSVSTTDSLF